MGVIKAFRAVRYNDRLLKYAAYVMTPPYDVISPEQQEFYYDQSPFNVIRLDLGKESPGDSEANNRYTRARDFLANWRRDGVLVEDGADSIYGYSQVYRDPLGKTLTRDGFVALLKLEEWQTGTVYPHEQTFSGPKEDRLRLVRATGHQMSLIFSLFSGATGEITPLISRIVGFPEVTRYTDSDGVEHIFTRCADPEIHTRICAAMGKEKIFIADGHHRYETFLAFRDEMERQGVAGDAHRYAAMYFTPLGGDSVTILPCHRVVTLDRPINEDVAVQSLGRYFTVKTFMKNDANTSGFIGSLSEKGKGSFGLYLGGDCYYLLTLTNRDQIEPFFPPDMNRLIKGLDVSVIQDVIITGIFGIKNPTVVCSQDAAEALSKAREGETAVFLLNSTTIQEVKEASLVGERMPQKSTYFYPKLASGLALYRMVP